MGGSHRSRTPEHEPAHRIDAADKVSFGQWNGFPLEADCGAIANADRNPRIERQRCIFHNIQSIFIEVIAPAQVGRPQVEARRSSPTAAGIRIVVSRVANHRGPDPGRRLSPKLTTHKRRLIRAKAWLWIFVIQLLRDQAHGPGGILREIST